MPSLKGYEVYTCTLEDGREIDVLHEPGGNADTIEQILVSGQQIAALTGDGRRSTGHYSTSDMGRLIDKKYQFRVPDPHKIYSKSRTRSTTLFAVEGLIQRTFHTARAEYIQFCAEFITHVLPSYFVYSARHAELILAWCEALYHFEVTKKALSESTFRAAVAARDTRRKDHPFAMPELVIGTPGCEQVLGDNEQSCDPARPEPCLCKPPLDNMPIGVCFEVAHLHSVYARMRKYRIAHPDAPPLSVQLVWAYHDLSVTTPDGAMIIKPQIKASPGPSPGHKKADFTADDVRQALLTIIRQELPGIVEPIVLKAVRTNVKHGNLANLVKAMTENVTQLVEITVINREQLELSRQSIDLITPSHQMFLSAKDYVEADGVADALRRAPKLTEPSFGLDHCTDYGKASLWMKRLCRAENRKVAMNAVARIIAKDAGEEEPPLYIPEFRMKRLERENGKVLTYNPACWARCKQTFLLAGTPTLLFPGPKAKAAPDADTKAKQV